MPIDVEALSLIPLHLLSLYYEGIFLRAWVEVGHPPNGDWNDCVYKTQVSVAFYFAVAQVRPSLPQVYKKRPCCGSKIGVLAGLIIFPLLPAKDLKTLWYAQILRGY